MTCSKNICCAGSLSAKLFFLGFLLCLRPAAGAAELNTGGFAPEKVDIALNEPVEFDKKTKAEIYALRAAQVDKYKELVSGTPRVRYRELRGNWRV